MECAYEIISRCEILGRARFPGFGNELTTINSMVDFFEFRILVSYYSRISGQLESVSETITSIRDVNNTRESLDPDWSTDKKQ